MPVMEQGELMVNLKIQNYPIIPQKGVEKPVKRMFNFIWRE